MTSSNGQDSNRLDRIEAIVESNSRRIQAMLEQRATDRLEHSERMRFLEENQSILIPSQRGMLDLVSSLDEDRPTDLRKLTAIEKQRVAPSIARRLEASPRVDTLLERNQ